MKTDTHHAPMGTTRSFTSRLLDAMAMLMAAHPKILQFLLNIVGVDGAKLQKAPRSEQVVYPALGALMCLAATFTGTGLSIKLSAGFGFGWLGSVGIFCVATAFALLLEMVVIGTLRTGTRWLRSVALRFLLGFCLMLLQVVPLLTIVFQPLIDLHQNNMVLQTAATARDTSARTYDVKGIEAKGKELAQAETAARAAVLNPPENAKVRAATDRVESASKALTSAIKSVDEARRRLAESEARLSLEAVDANKRKAIEKAVVYWAGQVTTRRKAVNDADTERSNAEADKAVAIKAWNEELEKAATAATGARKDQEAVAVRAAQGVEAATAHAEKLAQAAAQSRFFNDAAALLALMPSNPSVLLVSLFVMFVAMLIDMLPLLTKLQLSSGVYAQLDEDETAITRARSSTESLQVRHQLDAQKLQSGNELAAVRAFTQADVGTIHAAILAMRAEMERDSLALAKQPKVATEGLEAIRVALEKAREVKAVVDSDPTLVPLYRVQLEGLITTLEEAASRLTRQRGAPSGA